MRKQTTQSYPLDNSGIIHLAAMQKWHTNSFRLSITLTAPVDKSVLQSAFDRIAPRFPTIVAGITANFFRFQVVPVQHAPGILCQREILRPMTRQEIRSCAMRVLYSERQIAGEFFHALTDGTGGTQFMLSLLAEYLRLKYGMALPKETAILRAADVPSEEELADPYFIHSGGKMQPLECSHVYQLPGKGTGASKLRVTSKMLSSEKLLEAAHRNGVSLTTFLTAIMAEAVSQLQRAHLKDGHPPKPVQIMVPVNLRKRFPSRSLRNFSLYVLPCLEPSETDLPFEKILPIVRNQLDCQITKEKMAAAMTTNTRMERAFIMKILPLPVKCFVLRIAYQLFGEQTSCISLSNLGSVTVPEEMRPYISYMDMTLTPRIHSPYNCGIISVGDKCVINVSRYCIEPELEDLFFKNLSHYIAEDA